MAMDAALNCVEWWNTTLDPGSCGDKSQNFPCIWCYVFSLTYSCIAIWLFVASTKKGGATQDTHILGWKDSMPKLLITGCPLLELDQTVVALARLTGVLQSQSTQGDFSLQASKAENCQPGKFP